MLQISKERFALGSYQYLRYPFEYFLDTAVLLGMQNVELWAAGPSFCLDTRDEAQMKEKAAQIRSREISVCCITPEQQKEMISLMPSGSMKPMLDIGQMVYMDQKIERYLAHGTELSHIHLHDSHPAVHMALGDGDLPICEYLDILESAGYKGMYALEQNDPRYRSNPRQADIQSIRWLKKHGIFD